MPTPNEHPPAPGLVERLEAQFGWLSIASKYEGDSSYWTALITKSVLEEILAVLRAQAAEIAGLKEELAAKQRFPGRVCACCDSPATHYDNGRRHFTCDTHGLDPIAEPQDSAPTPNSPLD